MYTIFTILLPTLATHTKYMMISMIDLVVHLLIYWGISYTVFSSRDNSRSDSSRFAGL